MLSEGIVALPTELSCMETRAGFEPATHNGAVLYPLAIPHQWDSNPHCSITKQFHFCFTSILNCKATNTMQLYRNCKQGRSSKKLPFLFRNIFMHIGKYFKELFVSLSIMQRWSQHYAAYLRS